MSQPTNSNKPPKLNPKTQKPESENKNFWNSPNFRSNAITILGLIVLSAVIFIPSSGQLKNAQGQAKPKEFAQLVTDIRSGSVSEIEIDENSESAAVKVYKDVSKTRENVNLVQYKLFKDAPLESTVKNINDGLKDAEKIQIGIEPGKIIITKKEKPIIQKLMDDGNFWTIILILSSIGFGLFFIRKIAENNNRAISFGNSRAKLYDDMDGKEKVTFADVAGNIEAKQELTEVVDFLKRPLEYSSMGAKIPRGVLLVGLPGNGKTLMARAVAGEADVPFLYVSGSEFVEMFVGVGASRVRDLFKVAKKKAPCVIFIDEIDAVGRKRGQGTGGGNDEREQTLNQFLVEMDGFEGNESVIVLGATNRPDVLDQALLRPGRFDRQVTVTSPDRKEREAILKVHSKNKKLAPDIDLAIVARRTAGFSGADLMNVLNEGAILAVREKSPMVTNDILREAIEKVMLGPSLKSKVVTDQQKKLTAYHEAGHAIAATVLPKAKKVQKITIVPRGRAAGYTFSTDDENDSMTSSRTEFLSEIVVLFGGYTVEKQIFGDITTGASNDLAKASQIARMMVTKYGMSTLGPISLEESSMGGNDRSGSTIYSEATGTKIDIEVARILAVCQGICKEIVSQYQPQLEQISEHLLENETVEYEVFEKLTTKIKNSFVPNFEV